jgi:hypothetical protein
VLLGLVTAIYVGGERIVETDIVEVRLPQREIINIGRGCPLIENLCANI